MEAQLKNGNKKSEGIWDTVKGVTSDLWNAAKEVAKDLGTSLPEILALLAPLLI
jgi:hypothetical protein